MVTDVDHDCPLAQNNPAAVFVFILTCRSHDDKFLVVACGTIALAKKGPVTNGFPVRTVVGVTSMKRGRGSGLGIACSKDRRLIACLLAALSFSPVRLCDAPPPWNMDGLDPLKSVGSHSHTPTLSCSPLYPFAASIGCWLSSGGSMSCYCNYFTGTSFPAATREE
jgi:hypothetical protein